MLCIAVYWHRLPESWLSTKFPEKHYEFALLELLDIRPHKQTSLFHIPTRTQYLELIWSRASGKCAELGISLLEVRWCLIDGILSMKVER